MKESIISSVDTSVHRNFFPTKFFQPSYIVSQLCKTPLSFLRAGQIFVRHEQWHFSNYRYMPWSKGKCQWSIFDLALILDLTMWLVLVVNKYCILLFLSAPMITKLKMGDSRKYPYPTMGSWNILITPPCHQKFQNALLPCPLNSKIVKPSSPPKFLFFFFQTL